GATVSAICPYTTLFRSAWRGFRVLHRNARGRRRHEVIAGLRLLEGDRRPVGMEGDCAGCYRYEYRRSALCGRHVQHSVVIDHRRSEEHTSELQSRENLV